MEIAILYSSTEEGIQQQAYALQKRLQLPSSWVVDIQREPVSLKESGTVIFCSHIGETNSKLWPTEFIEQKKEELQSKRVFLFTNHLAIQYH